MKSQPNKNLVKLSEKVKNETGGAGVLAGVAGLATAVAKLTPALLGIAAIYRTFKTGSGEIKGDGHSVKWDDSKAAKAEAEKAIKQPIYFIY
ncbi:hypothetical protein [Mesomycoplasma flocculare]|uniref:hypothetical protein n=1 Tax=Mesomycoplasma flocculare TaxID=2128 RepID=UPI00136A294C|nr:hypothetical protein [Mesomycoplasma flocculare]MXR06031.1 hypothetical protein [Mesomycoplasma flocculare]MXR12445.1 hypothetical protein [Mesomycoplasma flocculare]